MNLMHIIMKKDPEDEWDDDQWHPDQEL